MKDLNMLVWLTQLGLSVVAPLAGFTCLAVWLRGRFQLGIWVVFVGLAVGMICAVDGFRSSIRMMERMERQREKGATPPRRGSGHEKPEEDIHGRP